VKGGEMKDKKNKAEILRQAYEGCTEEDLCTVEGIDSATGLPFIVNFRDLKDKKDTIGEAVDRINKG
jgi:hypothetical protein